MSTPLLQLLEVSKDFGDGLGLTPTSLAVEPGELIVLVGPNGAGKSTLLGLCAGILDPSEGSVLVDGAPVGSESARAATALIPDQPALYDDLSVWEHVDYVAQLHGVGDWDVRGEGLIERLGLAERSEDLPSRFSRGLRQKTSLVLGFLRQAPLLLIDEPFVGLDATGQQTLVALLTEAIGNGATALVSTHQLDLAELATRCIGLRDGEVVHDGPAGRDTITRLTAG
jgi:ABC-type multidrug transport system ATPase subunit